MIIITPLSVNDFNRNSITGMLLLIQSEEETVLWQLDKGATFGTRLNPIIICDLQILDGEKVYNRKRKTIEEWKYVKDTSEEIFCSKILAFPEHFSKYHLYQIIDKKLKNGDSVGIEFEPDYSAMPEDEEEMNLPWRAYVQYKIKLDAEHHITFHRTEKKDSDDHFRNFIRTYHLTEKWEKYLNDEIVEITSTEEKKYTKGELEGLFRKFANHVDDLYRVHTPNNLLAFNALYGYNDDKEKWFEKNIK